MILLLFIILRICQIPFNLSLILNNKTYIKQNYLLFSDSNIKMNSLKVLCDITYKEALQLGFPEVSTNDKTF